MSIVMNDQKIDDVKCTIFLGLYIDDEPSWKYHIDQIKAKTSKMTGNMTRVSHYLSFQRLNTIYNTMVYPYLTFSSIVWTSTYPTRLKALFIIQKKILRRMTFANFRDESKPLFLALDLSEKLRS